MRLIAMYRDLRLYFVIPSNAVGVAVLPPRRITGAGIPSYDARDAKLIGPFKVAGANTVGLAAAPEESAVYLAGGGIMDGSFPAMNKFSFDGRHLWGYWKAHPKWKKALGLVPAKKGESLGMTAVMGVAGEVVAVQTYFGAVDLWTRDGIYVDQLYNKVHTGQMSHEGIYAEWTHGGGNFVRTAKEGRYFLLGGDSDGRVNEVLGLDSLQRLKGVLTLTAADVSTAAAASEKYRRSLQAPESKLVIHPLKGLNWELVEKTGRNLADDLSFQAAFAYDRAWLVARWEVTAPHPLINTESDLQTIFKGGNVLDLELGANPKADPARKTAGAGDVRLVITRQNDKPVCVAYFKRIEGFKGQPVVLESPTGTEDFDRIATIAVEMDYQPHDGGFTATVRIPLKELGLQLSRGDKLHMDFGYRLGNSTGSRVSQRAYWANRGSLAAIVHDVPSEIRMEPANWATAEVE